MSLYGSRKLANNAPKVSIGDGFGALVNVNGNLVSVNGSTAFANTLNCAFHSDLTIGVHALTANVEKLLSATGGGVAGGNAVGFLINNLVTFTNTGAVGANGDLYVSNISVKYANVYLRGTGYANGDIVAVPANTTLGGGITARLVVTVGNSIIGNISTVAITSNGDYTANFVSLGNVQFTTVTGSGNAGSANIGTGLAGFAVHNTGAYLTLPTTTTLATIAGGSGVNGQVTLTFGKPANKSGGSGWILKKVRRDGKTTYETLVAGRSIWGDANTDVGSW